MNQGEDRPLLFFRNLLHIVFAEKFACVSFDPNCSVIQKHLHVVILDVGNRKNLSEIVFAEFSDCGMRLSCSENTNVFTFVQHFSDTAYHGFYGFTYMIIATEFIVMSQSSIKVNSNPSLTFIARIHQAHPSR